MSTSSISLLSYKLLSSDDKQYTDILKNIEKQMNNKIDIICLQGITPDFVRLMVAIINEKNTNTTQQRYWLVLNPTKYGQGVIINITKFSYRMINYAGDEQVQALVIHEHITSKVFYLVNIDLSTSASDIGKKIIDTLENYSREQKAMIIVGTYNKSAFSSNLGKLKITTSVRSVQKNLTSIASAQASSNKDNNIIHSTDFNINSITTTSQKSSTYNRVDYIIQLKGSGIHEFLHQ